MTAKTFTLITFGGFIAMALFSLVVVLVGGDWRGGNDDVFWFQFAGAALTFGAYGMYRQKWSPKITGARYLLAVERDLTLDEAAEICQCAVGTVKSRVSRARKALQATLEKGGYARDGRAAGDAMRSILAAADRLSSVRQS